MAEEVDPHLSRKIWLSPMFDESNYTGRCPQLPAYSLQASKRVTFPSSYSKLQPGVTESIPQHPHHASQTSLSPSSHTHSGASYFSNLQLVLSQERSWNQKILCACASFSLADTQQRKEQLDQRSEDPSRFAGGFQTWTLASDFL